MKLDAGVIYLLVGSKHAPNLIVSVATLRRFYSGPVAIVCEPDGIGKECAEQVAAEATLAPVLVVPSSEARADAPVPWRGEGSIHLCKTKLPHISPFGRSLFLDCDTQITGPIDEAFPVGDEVVLSGFQWPSGGRVVRRRLEQWRPFCPARVQAAIDANAPHVNTGLIGFSKISLAFADDWHATASVNSDFMDDELAAQVVCHDYPVRHLDSRFNRSSMYQGWAEDVRVWHHHRRMNYRDELGRKLWLPEFIQCLQNNTAQIRRWPIHRYNWRSLGPYDVHHAEAIRRLGVKMGGRTHLLELE